MSPSKIMLGSLLMLLASFVAFGQVEWNVARVPDESITIDGLLDEGVWASAEKNRMDGETYLYEGAIDGEDDCHINWSMLWDSEGCYLGIWFYDDQHFAFASQFLSNAHEGYDDDGLQIFIDVSFDDAWGQIEKRGGFYGDLGHDLIKGFGNLEPSEQYAGMWNYSANFVFEYWTVDEQQSKGWNNVFTSANGVDYEYESQWTWAGELMHNNQTPAEGHALGFDLLVADNDDGVAPDGRLKLTPLDFNATAEHWTKATLGSMLGIARHSIAALHSVRAVGQVGSYDIFGKRIQQALVSRDRNVRSSLLRKTPGKAVLVVK